MGRPAVVKGTLRRRGLRGGIYREQYLTKKIEGTGFGVGTKLLGAVSQLAGRGGSALTSYDLSYQFNLTEIKRKKFSKGVTGWF